MVRGLLTDARKTSYAICSSLLTAECSTVELPGITLILARGLSGRSNSQQLACKRAFGTAPNSR
jgi:hypothetical protein